MTLQEAIDLIHPGIIPASGIWADIGAGTGVFTNALLEILTGGKVIAVDKSPHALYAIVNHNHNVEYEIMEGDFYQDLHLPLLNGIIMANALHYANDHVAV